jgi:flagellar M-ring protein FliF
VRRLSIAVVLDNKQVVDDNGKVTSQPYSSEELTSLTNLVKEAVGFSSLRGDTVNVMNAEFRPPEVVKPLPELPIWQQPWVIPTLKQVLGGLVVLFMVMKLIKIIQRLAARPLVTQKVTGDELAEDQASLGEGAQRLPKPQVKSYEENLAAAKQLAAQAPRSLEAGVARKNN